MNSITHLIKLTGVLCLVSPLATWAEVKPAALFSDNMVLQRNLAAPVWGTAEKGEKVTVSFAGQAKETRADANGKWKVKLDPLQASAEPREMVISAPSATVKVQNVLVGEVWVCSGQSNMEFVVRNVINAPEELAQSANPSLRHFQVARIASLVPLEDCTGKWVAASPATPVGFTAVGYFFGRELQKILKIPVGLIHSSWGGSSAESWTSGDALNAEPELKELVGRGNRLRDELITYSERQQKYLKDFPAWLEANHRNSLPTPEAVATYANPAAPVTDWTPIVLPSTWAKASIEGDGVVWFRKDVTITPEQAGHSIKLEMDFIKDSDTAYFNGTQIGQTLFDATNFTYARRYYDIPANLVKEGKATIAVRVVSYYGNGMTGEASTRMKLGEIPMAGDWLYKVEKKFEALTPEAVASRPAMVVQRSGEHTPACLYNGMIVPILQYGIAGAIWYQGESNTGRAYQYRTLFPAMINDWRRNWGQGDFPFYFCQLANFTTKPKTAADASDWAELREAQSMTLKLPNTGQAVLIDIGEEADIHPRNKQDVGRRLAAVALAKTYGQAVAYSGPVYDSMRIEGNIARVKFTQVNSGLVSRELPASYQPQSSKPETVALVRNSPKSQLEGFAICGEDRNWQWADAVIDGDSVLVSSALVPKPVAVRYGWANNPTCNLYNKAGFPASPFRTDTWPGITDDKK